MRAHLTNGTAAQPSKFVVRTRDGRILTFKRLSAELEEAEQDSEELAQKIRESSRL